jgi:hypothetical protein
VFARIDADVSVVVDEIDGVDVSGDIGIELAADKENVNAAVLSADDHDVQVANVEQSSAKLAASCASKECSSTSKSKSIDQQLTRAELALIDYNVDAEPAVPDVAAVAFVSKRVTRRSTRGLKLSTPATATRATAFTAKSTVAAATTSSKTSKQTPRPFRSASRLRRSISAITELPRDAAFKVTAATTNALVQLKRANIAVHVDDNDGTVDSDVVTVASAAASVGALVNVDIEDIDDTDDENDFNAATRRLFDRNVATTNNCGDDSVVKIKKHATRVVDDDVINDDVVIDEYSDVDGVDVNDDVLLSPQPRTASPPRLRRSHRARRSDIVY